MVHRSGARTLAAGLGQLPLQGPGVVAVLPHLGFDLPDVLIDLLTVIAPHHRHELTRRDLLDGAGQLSVNVRVHVA